MTQLSARLVETLIRTWAEPGMSRLQIFTIVSRQSPVKIPWATFKRIYSGYVFKRARELEIEPMLNK